MTQNLSELSARDFSMVERYANGDTLDAIGQELAIDTTDGGWSVIRQ